MPRSSRRIDFPLRTAEVLARRAGMRCSYPGCHRLTCGPRSDPDKAVSIGVAAHITAAAPNGPRYDPSVAAAQRGSVENGIWLCQNHAKLIDNDPGHFTVAMLREWKQEAEARAHQAVETGEPTNATRSGFSGDRAAKLAELFEEIQDRLMDYKSACEGFFWPPQKPDGPAWQKLVQEHWKVREFLDRKQVSLPSALFDEADALLEHVKGRCTVALVTNLSETSSQEQRTEEYAAMYSFATHDLPNRFKELARSLQVMVGRGTHD